MESGLLDAAPIWTDLKTFPWSRFRGRVGILSGGYPCQPFSAAGKRLGKDDPRHLWPWIADGIREMLPGWCFFENVEGHISLGLFDVLRELEEIGYRTTWGIFSAAEVGAPHQRKRVFILAYRDGYGSPAGLSGSLARQEGFSGIANDGRGEIGVGLADSDDPRSQGRDSRILPQCSGQQSPWPGRPSEPQHEWEPSRVVADDPSQRWREGRTKPGGEQGRPDASECGSPMGHALGGDGGQVQRPNERTVPPRDGQTAWHEERQAKPPMGRVPHGRTYRVDELRLLGNGVVPATAERAFRTLLTELTKS